jgi:hypothetical protein
MFFCLAVIFLKSSTAGPSALRRDDNDFFFANDQSFLDDNVFKEFCMREDRVKT